MGYFSRLSHISKYIPFSYLWVYRKAVGSGVVTVLDIACGSGDFMLDLSIGEHWKVTGVDIYPKSLEKAKKTGAYSEFIKGDVLKVVRNLIRKKKKFDLVFCSATIEHLSKKDGLALLGMIGDLAKKRAVFSTPNGFMHNPHEFLEGNRYQLHKSGWTIEEFKQYGYKVHGAGLKFVWSEEGLARSKSLFISVPSRLASLLLSPFLYFFPSLSSDLIASRSFIK